MLKNDFYHTNGDLSQNDAGDYVLPIHFNADHAIFGGHFPEMKVVPGVTMVQIVKETLEDIVAKPTRMVKSSMIKFMAIIQPEVDPDLDVHLSMKETEGVYMVTANLKSAEKVFFKFKGEFHAAS